MKILWEQIKPTSIDVIGKATGKQDTAIAAALEDMVGKGVVKLEAGGYSPLLTAAEYCAVEVRGLVDQVYGGDAMAFLTDYIGTAGPEDRAALEDAINKGDRQS